ncbi:hypothetical protein CFP56_024295 [Quercus suber]|uniref:Uncharacterized protein n=1 Tax=Quercus suber TaxID=58331 RepID=A0AAW0MCE2_QUESU
MERKKCLVSSFLGTHCLIMGTITT